MKRLTYSDAEFGMDAIEEMLEGKYVLAIKHHCIIVYYGGLYHDKNKHG